MAAWKCGWCGEPGNMAPLGDGWVAPQRVFERSKGRSFVSQGAAFFTAFACPGCDFMSVAAAAVEEVNQWMCGRAETVAFWKENDPTVWKPKWVEGQSFPHVPLHIAAAAKEAYRSQAIENNMSAILMARSVIEATAKDKEISGRNLEVKIQGLQEQGYIRPHIQEAADGIRLFGNDMAHGDISVVVDAEDVTLVLGLMSEVLVEVYQTVARTSEIKAAVARRKEASRSQ